MKNNKKQEHPNFLKYKNFILNHNNYQGLYTNDQEKRWVAPGKTELGKNNGSKGICILCFCVSWFACS